MFIHKKTVIFIPYFDSPFCLINYWQNGGFFLKSEIPVDLYNTSDTRGTSQSYGLNYQKTGKELMSQDEIAVMDGGKCIMQLRGVRPFFSDKFDITKHKRYRELSDSDPKNAFDIEAYVKHLNRLKVSSTTELDEVFVCDGR